MIRPPKPFRPALLACFLSISPAVLAAPITYDFRGDLSQPIDGETQFAGSFTFDTTTNALPGFKSYWMGFFDDANMSIRIGDHPASINGIGNFDLAGQFNMSYDISHNGSGIKGDSFEMSGTSKVASPDFFGQGLSLGITLANPAGNVFPDDMPTVPTLNLADFPVRNFTIALGDNPSISGVITALWPSTDPAPPSTPLPTPAPEPTTLAFFALLGLGLTVPRLRKSR